MPFLNVKNRAESTLASGIDDAVTELTVATGEGALFPTTNFHITIEDEILLCSSRTDDVLTVVREQEGTTAAAHASGKAVELRITAGVIGELQDAHISKARAYISAYDYDFLWPSQVLLNVESYDELGEFASYKFTVTKAGYYLVTAQLQLKECGLDELLTIAIRKNGSDVAIQNITAATGINKNRISDIIYLAVNDYLELWGGAATTGPDAEPGANVTYMTVHRIS